MADDNPKKPGIDNEVAALTRRVDADIAAIKADTTTIKSDVLQLRLGLAATDQKLDNFITEQRAFNADMTNFVTEMNGFVTEQRAANAAILEAIAALAVGKTTD